MPYLLATLAAMAAGPLLYAWARRRPPLARTADHVVLTLIVLLVLLAFLPHAWQHGGWLILPFLLLGLFGPDAVERLSHRHRRHAHVAAVALAVAGLILHTLADGAVLATEADVWGLQAAIVLHSLPIGAGLWWLLAPDFGVRIATAALLLMALGTVLGFFVGLSLEALLGERYWSGFESFVAGAILHALFGRPHLDGPHRPH